MARPNLSDGALIAAAGAERVAVSVIDALADVRDIMDTGEWHQRKARLGATELAAAIAQERLAAVRRHLGLAPSTAAAAICAKYEAVLTACQHANATNTVPIVDDLDASRY